jgi:hypothetical protein
MVPYMILVAWSPTRRPKARGLAQPGGPPGWLEESDPAGVILYVIDGPYRLPLPCRTAPVALTGAAQLRAYGISSCCYIVNECTQPSVMSNVTQGRLGLVL